MDRRKCFGDYKSIGIRGGAVFPRDLKVGGSRRERGNRRTPGSAPFIIDGSGQAHCVEYFRGVPSKYSSLGMKQSEKDSAIESSLVEELSSSKAAGDGQHVPKEGKRGWHKDTIGVFHACESSKVRDERRGLRIRVSAHSESGRRVGLSIGMQMSVASLMFSIPMESQPRRPGGAGISDKKDNEECRFRGTGDVEGS
jgi:hypothetical protein